MTDSDVKDALKLLESDELATVLQGIKSLSESKLSSSKIKISVGSLGEPTLAESRARWSQVAALFLGPIIKSEAMVEASNFYWPRGDCSPCIEQVVETLALYPNITKLSLSRSGLTELPENINNLSELTTLNLDGNDLKELPDSIGNLTKLKELGLGYTQLTQLPDSIGNLTKLRKLLVHGNQLTELPDGIGNLTKLKELDLQSNQLTKLPDAVGNLSSLTKLELLQNQLTELPDGIGNLTKLKELRLSNMQLAQLPDSIGNLTKLRKLFVNGNQLTSLPSTIGNLGSLKELVLSNNKLTELPDATGNLTQLTRFLATDNQLTLLPDSIGKLSKLDVINLQRNNLVELPDSIDTDQVSVFVTGDYPLPPPNDKDSIAEPATDDIDVKVETTTLERFAEALIEQPDDAQMSAMREAFKRYLTKPETVTTDGQYRNILDGYPILRGSSERMTEMEIYWLLLIDTLSVNSYVAEIDWKVSDGEALSAVEGLAEKKGYALPNLSPFPEDEWEGTNSVLEFFNPQLRKSGLSVIDLHINGDSHVVALIKESSYQEVQANAGEFKKYLSMY